MSHLHCAAACAALMSLTVSSPASACWSAHAAASARMKKMETMLMVSALRCRNGEEDFTSDYNRFVTTNRSALNEAGVEMRAEIGRDIGPRRALDRYDSIVTGFANRYGNGVQGLGCHELHADARALADHRLSRLDLEKAAYALVDAAEITGPLCERSGMLVAGR